MFAEPCSQLHLLICKLLLDHRKNYFFPFLMSCFYFPCIGIFPACVCGEGVRYPGAGFGGGGELPRGCWELNRVLCKSSHHSSPTTSSTMIYSFCSFRLLLLLVLFCALNLLPFPQNIGSCLSHSRNFSSTMAPETADAFCPQNTCISSLRVHPLQRMLCRQFLAFSQFPSISKSMGVNNRPVLPRILLT